jgi:hypothetical protein
MHGQFRLTSLQYPNFTQGHKLLFWMSLNIHQIKTFQESDVDLEEVGLFCVIYRPILVRWAAFENSELKVEAVCSSEMMVSTYKSTWCYSPEGQYRHIKLLLLCSLEANRADKPWRQNLIKHAGDKNKNYIYSSDLQWLWFHIKADRAGTDIWLIYNAILWSAVISHPHWNSQHKTELLKYLFCFSPTYSSEVTKALSHTSTPPCVFTAWCLINHRNNITFNPLKPKFI